MASGSGVEGDVLSDRFLEQFKIRSEVNDDDQGMEDGGFIDWDLLDRRFSDDPGFREWVSRKTA